MKKILLGIMGTLAVVGALIFGLHNAGANPSLFAGLTRSATATTSPTYVTSGKATTTLSFDAYANGGGVKYDKALVMFQMTATGTAPVILARVEHSTDNIDWYSETIETTANTAVTTYAAKSLSFTFASTTAYMINGVATRVHETFTVSTPTRYTRVVFYSTNANAFDLWAQAQPYKEESR